MRRVDIYSVARGFPLFGNQYNPRVMRVSSGYVRYVPWAEIEFQVHAENNLFLIRYPQLPSPLGRRYYVPNQIDDAESPAGRQKGGSPHLALRRAR